MLVEDLSNEINKLKPLYQSEHKKPDANALMEAMMRGGWVELVEANGGKTLSFAIKSEDGSLEVFQEHYISDMGMQNNVIGFLAAADDAPNTREVSPQQIALALEDELLGFFEALHLVIGHALGVGNDIEVYVD